jgi:hypothetical protein
VGVDAFENPGIIVISGSGFTITDNGICPSPSPTSTVTRSISATPSVTPTITPSISVSQSPSPTPSITISRSISRTPAVTPSPTPALCYQYEYINNSGDTINVNGTECPSGTSYSLPVSPGGEGTTVCLYQLSQGTIDAYAALGLILTQAAETCP